MSPLEGEHSPLVGKNLCVPEQMRSDTAVTGAEHEDAELLQRGGPRDAESAQRHVHEHLVVDVLELRGELELAVEVELPAV